MAWSYQRIRDARVQQAYGYLDDTNAGIQPFGRYGSYDREDVLAWATLSTEHLWKGMGEHDQCLLIPPLKSVLARHSKELFH